MTEPTEANPLAEWNRLNIENTENALVSLIYSNIISTTHIYDVYSTWLLAGIAATTALLITNIESIIPFLTPQGFKWCGLLFIISIIFGVLSKLFALQCQASDQTNAATTQKTNEILGTFYSQAEKIEESAKIQGVELSTELEINKVMEKFSRPFPSWFRWLFMRYINKHSTNMQAGFLIPLRFFRLQCTMLLLQILSFTTGALIAIFYAQSL